MDWRIVWGLFNDSEKHWYSPLCVWCESLCNVDIIGFYILKSGSERGYRRSRYMHIIQPLWWSLEMKLICIIQHGILLTLQFHSISLKSFCILLEELQEGLMIIYSERIIKNSKDLALSHLSEISFVAFLQHKLFQISFSKNGALINPTFNMQVLMLVMKSWHGLMNIN